MSLINDALKRAKQAHQQNPPPIPPLQFRPVEPMQEGRPRSPIIIVGAVLGLVAVVALGGLVIWALAQQREASLQVEAKSANETGANATAAPVDPPLAPAPGTSPEEAMTNSLPAVTVAVAPEAPELKLQGIFFNPRSPSAVVNSRTVYVGDKLNGFRVLAITAHSVTLANTTTTNVLSLSE